MRFTFASTTLLYNSFFLIASRFTLIDLGRSSGQTMTSLRTSMALKLRHWMAEVTFPLVLRIVRSFTRLIRKTSFSPFFSFGFNITISTTASLNEDAKVIFSKLRFPFVS